MRRGGDEAIVVFVVVVVVVVPLPPRSGVTKGEASSLLDATGNDEGLLRRLLCVRAAPQHDDDANKNTRHANVMNLFFRPRGVREIIMFCIIICLGWCLALFVFAMVMGVNPHLVLGVKKISRKGMIMCDVWSLSELMFGRIYSITVNVWADNVWSRLELMISAKG